MSTTPNLLCWLRGWIRFRGCAYAAELKNSDQMQAALERERMRADRGGAGFALVEFRFADRRQRPAHLTQLASLLAGRLRATDEAGHLDADRIGALLPETGEAGARTLAEKICEAMAIDEVRLAHAIHLYPDRGDEASDAELPDTVVEDAAVLPADGLFVQPLPWWKRGLDVVGASAGLIVAAPMLLIAAAAIKLTSPGPVFFRQKRAGLGGKTFFIYKLRTMRTDAEQLKASLRSQSEQDGPAFKMQHDPRVTRIGKYLRITCVDELPQLWNVLRGDMSLVGPRPLPCDESEQCLTWQRRRLDVTPGLTCIWQVFGGMRVPFQEWMRMDLRYITSRKPSLDLALLFKTLWAVIRHRASR